MHSSEIATIEGCSLAQLWGRIDVRRLRTFSKFKPGHHEIMQ
jgi:hypothetical protein